MSALHSTDEAPHTIYRNVLTPEEGRPHKVCTVWPADLYRNHRAFGHGVNIPGRPGPNDPPQPGAKSNRYGFVFCPPGTGVDDMGHGRTLAIRDISAKRVAMDVIGLAVAGLDETPTADGVFQVVAPAITSSDLFLKGYFVPEGAEPTEKELSDAERRREAFMADAINKADARWNSTGKSDQIGADAMFAVRFLGLTREWAPTFTDARSRAEIPCPVCRKPLEKGVRKCLACNEWIDYEQDGSPFAVNDPKRVAIGKKL